MPNRWVYRSGLARMRCATPSRPTSSRVAAICAPSRSCLGINASPRLRSTRTSQVRICVTHSWLPTRALGLSRRIRRAYLPAARAAARVLGWARDRKTGDVPDEYTQHAKFRRSERRVPREAVVMVIREPDTQQLLNEGRWNERWHSQRRFGDRVLHVIWAQRDDVVVVFTTWWKSTLRRRRRATQ